MRDVAAANTTAASFARRRFQINPNDDEGTTKKIAVTSIAGWVLEHNKAMKSRVSYQPSMHDSVVPLPSRVNKILDYHFPSRLLLQHVLPLGADFNPDAGLWLRALSMPERRYFSFRREGKVISRVLEKVEAGR